ncbi:MAG: hypothetical protein QXN36_01615 [Candidatus Bathyarchaeia archaeon]
MEPYKGRLTFHFKNLKDYTVQITTSGKLGITYPKGSDFHIILEQLKPYLVKPDGSQAKIIGIIKKPNRSVEEKRPAEVFIIPNPNLNEKERKLYRLDVDFLNIVKELDKEWFQKELDKFNLKYGVTQKKGSLEQ